MDPDSQYLKKCWYVLPLANGAEGPDALSVESFGVLDQRDYITENLVPEIIGFTVYTIIFGELIMSQHSFSFTHQTPY
jgi:hypothetical protein